MKASHFGILPMIPLVIAGIAAFPTTATAGSTCAVTGNLVANCGFENGTYSSTVGGFTNSQVPIGWTANSGFDEFPEWDHVTNSPVNSGSYALSIGNDDGNPVPALSQTFSDTVGTTYHASFYLNYGGYGTSDTLPFFDAQIDGITQRSFTGQTGPQVYTLETFTFVGTGSDTLTFQGNTSPFEWYVDDVVVTAVPLPASAWLLLSGLVGVGVMMARKQRDIAA